jgi:putative oxidoreductase
MQSAANRAQRALLAQRILLACIIAAHGWARLLAGGVDPFGEWLGTQGIPFGAAIAYTITALEIVGSPLLAAGFFALYLCPLYAAIYVAGIVLVHAPAGWFVVGLGRNGMEYSVLLVTCLLSVAYQYFPARSSAANT